MNIRNNNGSVHDVDKKDILQFMKRVEPVYELKKDSVPPELVQRIRREAGL